MRFPRYSAFICTCFGLIPRMTRLQLRCIFSFGIPLALLVVFFVLHYYLLFCDEISLGILSTLTGMELLYAWNPCVGGYSSYTSQAAKDLALLTKDKIFGYFIVSTSRVHFWIFQGIPLVLLVVLTILRIIFRYYFIDCPWCWQTGIALKAVWLDLMGTTIVVWILNNWRDESNALKMLNKAQDSEKKRKMLTQKQKSCIFLFILPFLMVLAVSTLFLWAELNSWSKPTLNKLSCIEDSLFILGQCIGFGTWVHQNWNRERQIAKLSRRRRRMSYTEHAEQT